MFRDTDLGIVNYHRGQAQNAFNQQSQAWQQQHMNGLAQQGSGIAHALREQEEYNLRKRRELIEQERLAMCAPVPMPYLDKNEEKKSMIKELKDDMKKFMREHKTVVYWTIGLILIDRIYFESHFQEKLLKIAKRMIDKLEHRLDQIGAPNEKTGS